MSQAKWYKNPEMIVAFSALMIGIVTAFTSIYSAYVDRTYARASVWPRLEIFRSFSQGAFSYGVDNNGTGPAIIKYARIKYEGKPIKEWVDVPAFKDIRQSYIGNRTLPAQKSISPVVYKGENTGAILQADKSISIELCYCSIYDECWVIDRENKPLAVEQCSIPDNQKFLQ
jgi:hypothetical protein